MYSGLTVSLEVGQGTEDLTRATICLHNENWNCAPCAATSAGNLLHGEAYYKARQSQQTFTIKPDVPLMMLQLSEASGEPRAINVIRHVVGL